MCITWEYRWILINSDTFTEPICAILPMSFLARSTSITCSARSFSSASSSCSNAVSSCGVFPRFLVPAIGHVDKIVELVETGAYIQINAESLIGGIFDKRASFCKKLMKEGLVHFLGTDCHDFRTRRPNMKPAAEVVRKKHADQILYENPRKMLEGKSI